MWLYKILLKISALWVMNYYLRNMAKNYGPVKESGKKKFTKRISEKPVLVWFDLVWFDLFDLV